MKFIYVCKRENDWIWNGEKTVPLIIFMETLFSSICNSVWFRFSYLNIVEIFIIYWITVQASHKKRNSSFFHIKYSHCGSSLWGLLPSSITSTMDVGYWMPEIGLHKDGTNRERYKIERTRAFHSNYRRIAFLMRFRFIRNRNIYFPQYQQFLLSYSINV